MCALTVSLAHPTRAALAAHMRLADAYANQHALQQVPDERAEQLNERVLARARRDLEKALAGSRPLGAFYSRMLERIESKSSTVPLSRKGGPPPRPKPQSQKREQRIHHGRGTHAAMVDAVLATRMHQFEHAEHQTSFVEVRRPKPRGNQF